MGSRVTPAVLDGSEGVDDCRDVLGPKILQSRTTEVVLLRQPQGMLVSRAPPLISVIVRTYNSERFVREALQSVAAQDYAGPIELIISYDRGTTDHTLDQIVNFVQTCDRQEMSIVAIVHENMSPFRDLELCMKHATGPLLCFLDADCAFAEGKLRGQSDFMAGNGSHLSTVSSILIDEYGNPTRGKSGEKGLRASVPASPRKILAENYGDINMIMLDSFFLTSVLSPSLELVKGRAFDWVYEDWLITAVAALTNNIHAMDEPLVQYRIHRDNLTYLKERAEKPVAFSKKLLDLQRRISTRGAIALINEAMNLISQKMLLQSTVLVDQYGLGLDFIDLTFLHSDRPLRRTEVLLFSISALLTLSSRFGRLLRLLRVSLRNPP